jgi:hypothetical protein
MQTQFFWMLDSKTYQPTKLHQKISSYERDMIFLRQPINLLVDMFCVEISPTYLNVDYLL